MVDGSKLSKGKCLQRRDEARGGARPFRCGLVAELRSTMASGSSWAHAVAGARGLVQHHEERCSSPPFRALGAVEQFRNTPADRTDGALRQAIRMKEALLGDLVVSFGNAGLIPVADCKEHDVVRRKDPEVGIDADQLGLPGDDDPGFLPQLTV